MRKQGQSTMKKIAIFLTLCVLSPMVMANAGLPFVGKKAFNFSPHPEEQHIIEIQNNGEMTVSLPEMDSVLYQGKYQPLFPVYDAMGDLSGYYQFDGKTKINALNEHREFEMGCNLEDDDIPCQAEFYEITP